MGFCNILYILVFIKKNASQSGYGAHEIFLLFVGGWQEMRKGIDIQRRFFLMNHWYSRYSIDNGILIFMVVCKKKHMIQIVEQPDLIDTPTKYTIEYIPFTFPDLVMIK